MGRYGEIESSSRREGPPRPTRGYPLSRRFGTREIATWTEGALLRGGGRPLKQAREASDTGAIQRGRLRPFSSTAIPAPRPTRGYLLAPLEPKPYVRYGEMWGDAGRCGEMRGDVGRCGEMWGGVGRCEEMQGDMGRYGRDGEMRGDGERHGEMWGGMWRCSASRARDTGRYGGRYGEMFRF